MILQLSVILYFFSDIAEFDDYAEIVDDDPDYAHPMAGRLMNLVKTALLQCYENQTWETPYQSVTH